MFASFLFVNLECGELPKCVWTSWQTASFLDALIVNMCPEPFLQNLQAKNFQNASELHCKQFCFRTHKSWKCAQKFFCEPCKRRTFKMWLNFTANSSVFGRKNCDNAPRTFFINQAKPQFPKCNWTQQQIASFLDAKIVKMHPNFLHKPGKATVFKMRLNSTANSFVFGCKNQENAPVTFV